MNTLYHITCCDLSPISHPNSPAINIPSALRSFSRHPPPLHLARWPRRSTSKSPSSPKGIGHVQPSPPGHRTARTFRTRKIVQKSFSLNHCTYFKIFKLYNLELFHFLYSFFIFTLLLSLFTSLSLCKQPGLEISCSTKWRTETFKLCILLSRPRGHGVGIQILHEANTGTCGFHKIQSTQTVVDSAKAFQKL